MRFVTLLLAALSLPAQDIKQVGPYPYTWERIDLGSASAGGRGQLQVKLDVGRVVVRGTAGDKISFRLTRRARAPEAIARTLLSRGDVRISSNTNTTFVVSEGSSPRLSSAVLELFIPQQMQNVQVNANLGGWIDVKNLDGSIDLNTSSGNLEADGIRGTVSASTGGGWIHLGQIGGAINCYTGADSIVIDKAGGAVNCRTEGGEILLREATGTVRLFSGGGNIYVVRADATVEAHADSGLIRIDQAGGPVIADNTQGGSIQVGQAMGVRAQSAGGTVRVTGDMGPLNVATAMGNILAELMAGMALKDSSLAAASGDITVHIPSGLRVTVMAASSGGGWPRILSEFSEVQAQPFGFSRSPGMVQGAINGGGPILHISDSRGVIRLIRDK